MQGHNEIKVVGYFPGVIGRITELHAVYYHRNWGFDLSFETQVGRELSEFIGEYKEGRDGFWTALMDGEFAGSIAIDGRGKKEEGARLRWFIVEPGFHGHGIGIVLIQRALQFCEKAGYPKVFLWTFEGLDAARHIYERAGFRLAEEHVVAQWGQTINEQMFELVFPETPGISKRSL